jgi:hypothetical protein
MKEYVIVFVPAGAAQDEFALALRDYLSCVESSQAPERRGGLLETPQKFPLWTWFVSNPCAFPEPVCC